MTKIDLAFIEEFTLDERALHREDQPWISVEEGVSTQFLRLDRVGGGWVEVARMSPGAAVNRHRHFGQVIAYTLEGEWRYLERDWVARPGTLIWEPPGDVHTLEAGPKGMTTLFIIEGSVQYFDENDRIIDEDDVHKGAKLYFDHCREAGIEPSDIVY